MLVKVVSAILIAVFVAFLVYMLFFQGSDSEPVMDSPVSQGLQR